MNNKHLRTHRWCLALLVAAFLVALACLTGIPQQKYREYTLEKFYQQLVVAQQTEDWRYIYDRLTYEQRREETYEEFAAARDAEPHPFSLELIAHSFTVDIDRGIVDRTFMACMTEACEGEDYFEERAKKEYLYINGSWYAPKSNSLDDEGRPFETELPER